MQKFTLIAVSVTLAALLTWAADWPSQSGNAQRDGWAKAEKAFTRDNAKNIELLYKVAVDNRTKSLMSLTTPIVNGNLITYLGFKEMLVFGGSQDNVYSIDADLNRRIWSTHFDYKGDKPAAAPTSVCPGGLTASLVMPGSSTAVVRGGAAPAPGRGVLPAVPGVPAPLVPVAPVPVTAPPVVPGAPGPGRANTGLFATGFGKSGLFIAVSSDGYAHPLNTSTGVDKVEPVRFLPANAKVNGLNLNDGVLYAATEDGCGGAPNGLYAIDLGTEVHKLSTFETHGSGPAGSGGTAIGNDGTVYAQIREGKGEVAGGYNDTVVAFTKDLHVKDYFTPGEKAAAAKKNVPVPGITPVVFAWKGRDVIVAAGKNGRVYLLDGDKAPGSLGGPDHHTPLAETDPIASPDLKYAGNGFQGTFSSWEEPDTNARWIYASLQGPPNPAAKFAKSNGDVSHGGMVAFRLEEREGKPVLDPVWISRDMTTPAPPVTANGLVFALARGESSREAKENGSAYSIAEREGMAGHATLFVLDGATGAELYSSGNMAATFAHDSGLALANKRIYFSTHDNTVFAVGFTADQPQLTGR